MSRTRLTHRRRLVAGITPFVLALGALPLLAPTCGDPGEGFKTFSRNSIIIPMDVCYQRQTDGTGVNYTPSPGCPQTPDAGDVIRAYGLVYQLIRNDIAVYWVIDNAKTAIDGIDFSVQYAGGPVLFYDWSPEDPPPATLPTAQPIIDYRGGPFVVDGSDFARASAVLQSFRNTFQNVNVHVSNVAFRAYAKRTMAGGWSAGGTVAPKVALLDIGSTSNVSGGYAKNSEPIIRGYLARAGLDFPGAGGVATDAGHGQIYDRLGMADLQPSTPGDWTTTNLGRYGYQILWVPHWFAPGSCSNATSQTACVASLYPLAQRDQALTTVGAFVAAGKDLFAECAGLGSFEGVASGTTGWSVGYSDGDPTTHFHVTNGLGINKSVGTAVYDASSVTSPLLQLGDYPFRPETGAIQNYRPAPSRSPASTYTAVPPAADGVARLFTDQVDPSYDYFTYRPPGTGRGTTVYLGGHVYSGYSDTLNADGSLRLDAGNFAIGGTRLVLNTLFNLGAACTASGVACNTGQAGICAQGTIQCQGTPAVPVCTPLPSSVPGPELCNGLDDDCDWEVDEGLEVQCYGGPGGTQDVGLCRAGISSCLKNPDDTYSMSACVGQVLPAVEVCNALDDDCDGSTDEGLSQACYEGPSSSIDPTTGQPRPACAAGTQTCTLGSWGACIGQILPRPEVCTETPGNELDDDCDGVLNNNCGCINGQTIACYTGPAGTRGVPVCQDGLQTCTGGAWGPCEGQVLPSPEVCGNSVDENCDTIIPTCPGCTSPAAPIDGTAACNSLASFPGAIANTGQCQDGTMTCGPDSTWGSCVGEIRPSPFETCDNVDNDCDGTVDESAICPTSFTCLAGVCVPDACGVEVPPPEGYACDPDGVSGTDPNGEVIPGDCGGTGACAAGDVCRFGTCVPPCTPDQCAAGSLCGGGACIAGACYATGCPAGQLCREGACVADPCDGVLCPGGTFCREGDCVQACTFVSCAAGERCGEDGFCVPDACAGVSCGAGERCTSGACAPNPCATRGCAQGQVCTVDAGGSALCVDDPCAGITCPAGACSGGQCYSTANPTGQGQGSTGGGAPSDGGCGCGSGPAAALPALLALLAAPLARRRRRSGGPTGRLALLLAASVLLGSACKEDDKPFDPATCAATCDEPRCVDLQTDVAHCGACGAACGGGEICVDAVCGPSSAVAPFIDAISPPSGPPGSLVPVTVQITGERFSSGATVRTVVGSATRSFPTTFVSASQLSVDLDLSTATAAEWRLRVVNPDRVISNAVTFDVVVPAPFLTSVQGAVTAGQIGVVLLTGTGFTGTSQGHLRSVDGSVPDFGLPSTVDAAGVHCTIDATALPPGAYEIWVVNEGGLASNRLPLVVSSDVAELLSLSPSSGGSNEPVTITVTGTGFDLSSRVLFDGCAGPNDPAGCGTSALLVGTSFVDSTRLTAALTLPSCGASCPHSISVRNGGGATTGILVFTVASDQPTISTFSPATAYQGENPVTLTFTGTGFPAGTGIEVQEPAGTFVGITTDPVTGCAPTCTVSGTMSLVGKPEGSWLSRLNYGGGLISAAWPFRVLSNQAILQSMTPRSGAQGTSPAATVGGANLRPPYDQIRVRFRNAAGSVSQALVPSPTPSSPSGSFTFAPNLNGLDTGTYSVAIENPNAAPSNALSFTVTPGAPTVTAVCRLEGGSCAATNPTQAQQGPNPVPVRITGTNFAKPDLSGNGSTVMVTASFMPGYPTACPAAPASPPFQPVPGTVEVVSPTEIVVQLDTLSALANTTYYVAVWNPGGAVPPQESYPCPTTLPGTLPAFTILP